MSNCCNSDQPLGKKSVGSNSALKKLQQSTQAGWRFKLQTAHWQSRSAQHCSCHSVFNLKKGKKLHTLQSREHLCLSFQLAVRDSGIQQMTYLPALETAAAVDGRSDIPGEGSGSDRALPSLSPTVQLCFYLKSELELCKFPNARS